MTPNKPVMKTLLLFYLVITLTQQANLRTNSINLIVNGNFQNPSFSGTQFTTTQTLFGWQERLKNTVTFVKASAFNSMYSSTAQALSIGPFSRVYQTMTLAQKDLMLSFSVGLGVKSLISTYNFTSSLRVFWNDKLILEINPTTPTIQYVKTRVTSRNGTNTLQFTGNGNEDCDLINILVDDVNLNQIIEFKGKQIYAGLSGAGKVTFSNYRIDFFSNRNYLHNNYLLDHYFPKQPGCWCPIILSYGQWIQISTDQIRQWIAIIIQGRNDDYVKGTEYVKKYKISYTVNGIDWTWAQNGRIFDGNSQGQMKQRSNFVEPINAIGIRLYPTDWNGYICMRFDAIFRM